MRLLMRGNFCGGGHETPKAGQAGPRSFGDRAGLYGNKRVKNIIALGAFLAVGLALAIYGGVRVEHALASGGWPTVEGSVISSTTDSVSGRRGAANYEAKVSYRYEVEGKQYFNDVISFR